MKTEVFNKDTIPEFLNKRAKSYPNDIVYRFPELDQHYSWSMVWSEVRLLAEGFLREGIKKGDRVAILMQGRMEVILSIYALACIGAIAVPLNTYSKKDELINYLRDIAPKTLITESKGHLMIYPTILEEMMAQYKGDSWLPDKIYVLGDNSKMECPFCPYSDLKKDNQDDTEFIKACQSTYTGDPFIIFYTSGTTGVPKAVIRNTASFLPLFKKSRYKVGARFRDRLTIHLPMMNLLPLYHFGGFSTIFMTLRVCNICMIMSSHFNPNNACTILNNNKCRLISGTPYMLRQILSTMKVNGYCISGLYGVISGTSPVDRTLVKDIKDKLNPLFFIIGYGSTETGSVTTGMCLFNQRSLSFSMLIYKILKGTNLINGLITLEQFENCAYSIAGKILKNVEVRIEDQENRRILPLYENGEICVRSHHVMNYNEENNHCISPLEGEWFKTGDLGFLDESGLLTITGRIKRIINRGGEKISPIELENILLTIKGVHDVYVTGISDERYGEEICACIIPEKGLTLTVEGIRKAMETKVSAFKIPKYILFQSRFPVGSTGKISMSFMQQTILEQLEGLKINA